MVKTLLTAVLVLLVPSTEPLIASAWAPTVHVGDHRITGKVAEAHQSVSDMAMVITDQTECEAKVASPSAIEYSDSCQLIQGYFKYTYKTDLASTLKEVYTEFLVRRSGSKNHIILINSPLYMEKGGVVSSD